ncbi:hypothetical protein B566_EDAN004900 [Ephemera danica]|nr:hypothetical protein B566_EDAN004900 [Ephemera danica]
MAPPTYGDLGKSARDIFGKGYHLGVFKLDLKTKTPSGIEFSSGGSHSTDTGKVSGNLETKYKKPEYGVTLTLSTLVDAKNFNQGGHKVGLGLELEP